jgi:radical SAM protein with 4Fe4S-binding SPASM domain
MHGTQLWRRDLALKFVIFMEQLQYCDFSLKMHQKKWQNNQPNACQFELTFACPLHCKYCYTDCYNNQRDIKKELKTEYVLRILDKVHDAGVLWASFTGGDPLARQDFLAIYRYAIKKGFIVTLFTSGTLITENIADYLEDLRPFCVELTLNALIQNTHEAISGVKGSFEKAMSGIARLKKRNIPFKIKTQVTKHNARELDKIKKFVEDLDLKFRPNFILFPRLDHDLSPCQLRITPEEVLEIMRALKLQIQGHKGEAVNLQPNENLFRCASGQDSFNIDPYGNMFLCSTVRMPSVNLLKDDIAGGFKLFKQIKARKFKKSSKCLACPIWHICDSCPGVAALESGKEAMPLDYFCRLAHLLAEERGLLSYET